MADDFISKLRMANIFPVGGGPRQTPFGMPNLNSGNDGSMNPNQIFNMIQQSKDLDMQRQMSVVEDERNYLQMQKNIEGQRKPQLSNIAQSSLDPNQGKQVLYGGVINDKNKITPYQRESLDIQRERLAQTGNLGSERLDVTRRGQDISSRRAELAEKVASGRATDEEKHDYAMALIEARGDVGSRQITERGDITSRQIGERGDITSRQIGERGDITSRQIGERGNEQRQTNQAKPVNDKGQTKAGQQINAQEIINTRPDLAKYIKYTPEGLVEIDPNTPLNEMSMIQGILYPKKDINLSPDKPSDTKKPAPKSTAPTAADLIKKYGG